MNGMNKSVTNDEARKNETTHFKKKGIKKNGDTTKFFIRLLDTRKKTFVLYQICFNAKYVCCIQNQLLKISKLKRRAYFPNLCTGNVFLFLLFFLLLCRQKRQFPHFRVTAVRVVLAGIRPQFNFSVLDLLFVNLVPVVPNLVDQLTD